MTHPQSDSLTTIDAPMTGPFDGPSTFPRGQAEKSLNQNDGSVIDRESDGAVDETGTYATALDLLSSLLGIREDDQVAHALAIGLVQTLDADAAWVLWRCRPGPVELLAGAGTPVTQLKASEVVAFVEAAGEEVIRRDVPIFVPPLEAEAPCGTPAVNQLSHHLTPNRLVAYPIRPNAGNMDRPGFNEGAILIGNVDRRRAAALLAVLGPSVASHLQTLTLLQPSPTERLVGSIARAFSRRAGRMLWLGIVAILILMCLPVRYTMNAACELQPVNRRYVAAAADGPLRVAWVNPGDRVHAGQAIAEIHPREIDFRLAGLQAQLEQAVQNVQSSMAKHDLTARKIHELEHDNLQSQIQWLQHQRSRLKVVSPIDGIVVTGDWQDATDVPVSRGEVLFEIAPLDRMVAEIRVPEGEYRHVKPGSPVKLRLDAMPTKSWPTVIERIHPQAEMIDQENVFVAEAIIREDGLPLRPGMSGSVKIYGTHHSIAWTWLHRPMEWLRTRLGW